LRCDEFAGRWQDAKRRCALHAEAPAMWRVQTVRNLDAWYDAFKVQPGEKLYLAPDKRVHVW